MTSTVWFHISKKGSPVRCPAKIKCTLSDNESHFTTIEEALEHIVNENSESSFNAITKYNAESEKSAEMTQLYTQWAILNSHLRNAGNIGIEESFYYSSPSGRLEMERRIHEGSYRVTALKRWMESPEAQIPIAITW